MSGVEQAIERHIAEFLASDDERLEWVRGAVRTHHFLPLHLGWVTTLGVCPDGSLIRWDHEDAPEAVTAVDDPFLTRWALGVGCSKFPDLRQLLPERPARAVSCNVCGGDGEVGPDLLCKCGGLGWLLPEELDVAGPVDGSLSRDNPLSKRKPPQRYRFSVWLGVILWGTAIALVVGGWWFEQPKTLRGIVTPSPDGKTYLSIDDDNGGLCGDLIVDAEVWQHPLGHAALIEPGIHSIDCASAADFDAANAISFEIPAGVVFRFDYWGP